MWRLAKGAKTPGIGGEEMIDERRSFVVLAFTVVSALILCGGCVAPQVVAPKATSRSALEQELISKALRQSLGETPNEKMRLSILKPWKVAVKVSCISGSEDSGGSSEDARFVESVIAEKLLEEGVVIVPSGSEEALVQVVVETLGTDVSARYFPHAYLPLFYYISYRATASVILYAYDAKGKEPLMRLSYRGRGEQNAKEWSLLGLGPFR
jgi:hypothetical protein